MNIQEQKPFQLYIHSDNVARFKTQYFNSLEDAKNYILTDFVELVRERYHENMFKTITFSLYDNQIKSVSNPKLYRFRYNDNLEIEQFNAKQGFELSLSVLLVEDITSIITPYFNDVKPIEEAKLSKRELERGMCHLSTTFMHFGLELGISFCTTALTPMKDNKYARFAIVSFDGQEIYITY
ncbi:gp137 [Sphingomonas phage PAU]|uniref:gp137 n=1 Tax=Sphingomonas phage PAU TaxID=1150991 RepID=UPI00025732D5|nr:gp137 [Sphingomonas phage PAU]AFF28135.1 gp137 [Sphingomonas phage PAU]